MTTRRSIQPTLLSVSGIFISLALLFACTPSTDMRAIATDPTPEPLVDNLPKVALPDGFTVTLELAQTPEETSVGLMYRPSLPEDRGMLLLFGDERLPSIWMKNTLISLDIVFLDHQGAVVDVVEGAPPCKTEPCPLYVPNAPSSAVLELTTGAASRHRVTKGSVLQFSDVEGYPRSQGEAEPRQL